MRELFQTLLDRLLDAPDFVIYLVLGALAALENIVPPVPADVVVLVGGVLAGRGQVDPLTVFLVVWICNVLGALLVFMLGRHFGPRFFSSHIGHLILRPGQLTALGAFYTRFGFGVIFVSRFLPMFRAVVPAFAGVAGLGLVRSAIPIATASALWYGLLVYVGVAFGSNWESILVMLQSSGRWTGLLAALVLAGVAAWWWRSRRTDRDPEGL